MLWCVDLLLSLLSLLLLCFLNGVLQDKFVLDHVRLCLLLLHNALLEAFALNTSLETSARFKCEQEDVHCDVGERDAQVKDAEVTPELSLANYVCEEDEHVGQAQNCDLVKHFNFVATRVG